jgi:hypothetical protein
MREKILVAGVHHCGRWNWPNSRTNEVTSSIVYEVFTLTLAALEPPRRQAGPAAEGSLLRLPALPRPDLHQLPGKPQARPPVSAHGPQPARRLRHRQASSEAGDGPHRKLESLASQVPRLPVLTSGHKTTRDSTKAWTPTGLPTSGEVGEQATAIVDRFARMLLRILDRELASAYRSSLVECHRLLPGCA